MSENTIREAAEVEALAEAWASIDGKDDHFRRERDENIPWEDPSYTGHYVGYIEEAKELIRRLETRGFALLPQSPEGIAQAKPVAYANTEVLGMLDERGMVVYPRPMGTYTTPLYAASLETSGEGWRDIETAPKDGAYLVANDLGEVCPAQSYEGHRLVSNMPGYNDWTWGHMATHWMPLPAPPALSSIPAGGDVCPPSSQSSSSGKQGSASDQAAMGDE